MHEVGLEPTRPCEHWHLKPASLPIPPLVQVAVSLSDESYITTVFPICQHFSSGKNKSFFTKVEEGVFPDPVQVTNFLLDNQIVFSYNK